MLHKSSCWTIPVLPLRIVWDDVEAEVGLEAGGLTDISESRITLDALDVDPTLRS